MGKRVPQPILPHDLNDVEEKVFRAVNFGFLFCEFARLEQLEAVREDPLAQFSNPFFQRVFIPWLYGWDAHLYRNKPIFDVILIVDFGGEGGNLFFEFKNGLGEDFDTFFKGVIFREAFGIDVFERG